MAEQPFRVNDATASDEVKIGNSKLFLNNVAVTSTSAELNQLSGITLGTAAQDDTGDFATAAQGVKADSAIQAEGLLLHRERSLWLILRSPQVIIQVPTLRWMLKEELLPLQTVRVAEVELLRLRLLPRLQEELLREQEQSVSPKQAEVLMVIYQVRIGLPSIIN